MANREIFIVFSELLLAFAFCVYLEPIMLKNCNHHIIGQTGPHCLDIFAQVNTQLGLEKNK